VLLAARLMQQHRLSHLHNMPATPLMLLLLLLLLLLLADLDTQGPRVAEHVGRVSWHT